MALLINNGLGEHSQLGNEAEGRGRVGVVVGGGDGGRGSRVNDLADASLPLGHRFGPGSVATSRAKEDAEVLGHGDDGDGGPLRELAGEPLEYVAAELLGEGDGGGR